MNDEIVDADEDRDAEVDMISIRLAAAADHAATGHGADCEGFALSAHRFADHVCLYCASCRVVLGKMDT